MAKEDLQKSSEDIKDGVSRLTELAAMAASTGGNAPMCYQEMEVHHATYAQALSSQLPPTHLSML